MSKPLLDASRKQPTETTPIWLMRQAGRCLPAYRKLRERYSFTELTDDPELIAAVTLMPFEVADLDAAIIFADMMTPVPALGIGYRIVEGIGPVVDDPIRSITDIDAIQPRPLEEVASSLFEGIKAVKDELPEGVTLIGFSGAPFTLASYLIEGKPDRTFPMTRRLMADPDAWNRLMDRLCSMLIDYLRGQVEAGVEAVQLFDSWAGALTQEEYTNLVLPHTRKVLDALAPTGVPRIHFGTQTRHLLEAISSLECEVISVSNDIHLDEAWSLIGDKAIQGNLDPVILCGPRGSLTSAAREVMSRAGGRAGHIFNLGHGVLPETPADNLRLLVDLVHEEGKR